MNDNDAIKYHDSHLRIRYENRDKEYVNYLLGRFQDLTATSDKDRCQESIYRIKHKINRCPCCEICGAKLKFLTKYRFYESACCQDHKKLLARRRLQKTSIIKYGVSYPSQSLAVKEKQQETNNARYGATSPLSNPEIKKKAISALVEKYGSTNISKTNYWKIHTKSTSLQKYGVEYPCQSELVKEKMKQTCWQHFGVDNYFKTDQAKKNANSPTALQKSLNTKKRNHSLKQSKPENFIYDILKLKYPDVRRQFRSWRYPFNCDFYIPSIDLYIECNLHWTHGGHPYTGSPEDKIKADKWRSKHTNYYDNAVKTWTVRDVRKRETAKVNRLQYIELWSIDDIYKII